MVLKKYAYFCIILFSPPGASFLKLRIITRPIKLFCFPFQMGASKGLKIVQYLSYQLKKQSGFYQRSKHTLLFLRLISKFNFGPLKVAQNSFQLIPRLRFWCVIITSLYQLMPQSWYQKKCPIFGEYIGIIFVTQ